MDNTRIRIPCRQWLRGSSFNSVVTYYRTRNFNSQHISQRIADASELMGASVRLSFLQEFLVADMIQNPYRELEFADGDGPSKKICIKLSAGSRFISMMLCRHCDGERIKAPNDDDDDEHKLAPKVDELTYTELQCAWSLVRSQVEVMTKMLCE